LCPLAATAAALDASWLIVVAGVLAVGGVAWWLRQHFAQVAELKASAERHRALMMGAVDGLGVLSVHGTFTRANPSLARLFGCATVEELLALPPSELARRHALPAAWEQRLARANAGDAITGAEAEIRRPDGSASWVVETLQVVRPLEGSVHFYLTVTDVTERKRTASALTASEQRYRVLFDHLPIGIVEYDYCPVLAWLEDLRGKGVADLNEWFRQHPELLRSPMVKPGLVGANVAALQLFGLRNVAEGVANLDRIYTGDVYEARRKILLALWHGHYEADGDFTVQTNDERVLRLIYRWRVPLIDGLPHLDRTQLVLVDVTEIKSAEQALAAERERLSVTLRAMSEAVVTIDQGGVVQFMNDAAAQLTGWPVGAAVGHALREVFVLGSDKSSQPLTAPLAMALSSDRPVDLPPYTTLRPREGPPRSVEGRIAPMHDLRGQAIGAVLVVRDVTHRARLEADLLRASKLESIGVLAGGIAHDFNNLLSIVMGNLSLAAMECEETSPAAQRLREGERALLRARDLTQQLLTFAKGGEPVRAAVPLADVVRDAAQFSLHGSSVRGEFNIAQDLRPADADKGQIGQVVQNLVINAVQAMPGGGTIRVDLSNEVLAEGDVVTLPGGEYLRLEIADTGRGIAPEHLTRIFEPFFTTKEFGSGLGLATVYSVIKKHRGHIAVESTVGVGTTFRIWLPAARPEPVRTAAVAGAFEPIKGRILFMDDEEPIRMMTKTLLERLGLEVQVASDGAEAVREYAAARSSGRPYDVVVFDLTVPGAMGGADAMREILKLDPTAKGIVSSGYSSDPVMANFQAHGFRGSVPKPYRMSDFSRTLREVMSHQ
jgi:PAS domain S-box-containing protein